MVSFLIYGCAFMKIRDKKLTLLLVLSQEAEPISLLEILKKLPEAYSERTVRRWLAELADEGLVKKTGSKRGMHYLAIKNDGEKENHLSSRFSSTSAIVLEKVRRPIYDREPVTYNPQWLESYRPNKDFYLSEMIRNRLRKAGNRASNHDPAGTYAHQIYNRLLIDLTYNSSRLEGNTYSLLDTERLVIQGISAEGKLDEEKIMIINHKEAIRYLVDNALRLQITVIEICTLHYLLSDSLIEPKYTGKVRDQTVRIGGSVYIPMENQKELTLYLEKLLQKGAAITDPFEQSLFLLIHISYLQAFLDVNKRTARLAANIPLIVQNFVPLSFNDVEKGDYLSAMIAVYELQDIRPLIDLYMYSYLRTCAAYDSTVKTFGFDLIRVRYRQQRRSAIQQIIVTGLTGPQLDQFIVSAAKQIPKEDQAAFIEDLMEDLRQMDASRLAGLGVTLEQLELWQKAHKRRN